MSARTGNQLDVIRILDTPVSHYDVIQEGPFATVARAWTTIKNGVAEWVVVKSATTQRKFAREPHDIVKELRVLSTMTHANIIQLLGSFRDEGQSLLSIYMPYLPMSLASLLESPRFSPYPFPPPDGAPSPMSRHHPTVTSNKTSPELQTMKFNLMARSILAQTLDALAFLHDPIRSVGHRDIKPENIMLTKGGCVKLIDFGVAWKENESDLAKSNDLWPEYKGKLYFQVCTRAYRAPELLFGSRNYDHLAIDLWSLGVTFAEFFTSLRLHGSDDYDEEDDDEEDEENNAAEETEKPPFIIPRYLRIGYPGSHWRRDSLFDGQRGDIGLAWSIFKILGTPNSSNWPDFKQLPGASSVVFKIVPGVPLRPLLANLPDAVPVDPATLDSSISPPEGKVLLDEALERRNSPTSLSPMPSPTQIDLEARSTSSGATDWMSIISAGEGEQQVPSALDLLRRFLMYPAAARLRAEDALRHPWFLERLDGKPTVSERPGVDKDNGSSAGPSPICGHETSTFKEEPSLGSNVSEEKMDQLASPLLLLPPGYALEREMPDLKSISSNSWCGLSLGDLLSEVIDNPASDV